MLQKEETIKYLNNFDVISFDVFDTLITRKVLHPEDIFYLVEKLVSTKYSINKNFHDDRMQAERQSYKSLGDRVNINDIYENLRINFSYSKYECNLFMNEELFIEQEVSYPRRDMIEILQLMQLQGKEIILISDMYLSCEFIKSLLVKHGIDKNIKLLVSNEYGQSKYNKGLFTLAFSKYSDKKIIHIGDNKKSDYQNVKELGKEALLINNPLKCFSESELYKFLNKFDDKNVANKIILGYLINVVCFNSPFELKQYGYEAIGLWGGSILGCFVDWLVSTKDDTLLLFVTREGYVFKPLYDEYCKVLDIVPQKNVIFFSSRIATTAASIKNEVDLKKSLKERFKGRLDNCLAYRFNYSLEKNNTIAQTYIELPQDIDKVMNLIKPYLNNIIKHCYEQKQAYKKYIDNIIKKYDNDKFTIIDIGYSGTAQYNISKIINDKISGKYMFLRNSILPDKINCKSECLVKLEKGVHPIYENLLFLECALQVPYGQLRKIFLDNDGNVREEFDSDVQENIRISEGQTEFIKFVKYEATWKKLLGQYFKYDFELAETIWILMLKFDYLPNEYLESLWQSDKFTGHDYFKYDPINKIWITKLTTIPFVFPLTVDKFNRINVKYFIKNIVEKYVPNFMYEKARNIWINYLK